MVGRVVLGFLQGCTEAKENKEYQVSGANTKIIQVKPLNMVHAEVPATVQDVYCEV